jgi:dihydrolipoamide dehydrogenase
MAERLDLVVVGAGPGGYVAAIRAAQLGMRVACVEKDAALGGTCLNVGCIPSKALLDSSELFHQAAHGLATHGIRTTVELDLAAMMARKTRVVRGLTQGIAGLFKKHGIEWVRGGGRLAAPDRVEVAGPDGTRTLETARILIATGSEPAPLAALPFDGERIVTSTEALALPRVPPRLLVVGAGAVGLELGSVWRRLGAAVTVVEYLDEVVPAMDRGMAKQLRRALERQGIAFRLGTAATAADRSGDGVRVTLTARDGEATAEEADVVLVAVGRRPYTEGLGARELGVALDEKGRIVVDGDYRTSVPGVFAIGDVIPGPMLAHKAEEEGIAAVERMAGQPGHVNYDAVPSIVYTAPELASVGLSEEEAKARGIAYAVGQFPFQANGRARALGETEGGVKMLADARTDRLLGVHILGPRASDLIAEAAVAIEFQASAEDIARSVHAHPTLPEAVREAALAVGRRSIHI